VELIVPFQAKILHLWQYILVWVVFCVWTVDIKYGPKYYYLHMYLQMYLLLAKFLHFCQWTNVRISFRCLSVQMYGTVHFLPCWGSGIRIRMIIDSRGRILGRNWVFLLAIHSHLYSRIYIPPPLRKSGLKLVCNVNIVWIRLLYVQNRSLHLQYERWYTVHVCLNVIIIIMSACVSSQVQYLLTVIVTENCKICHLSVLGIRDRVLFSAPGSGMRKKSWSGSEIQGEQTQTIFPRA
jgi:hypothetical protein